MTNQPTESLELELGGDYDPEMDRVSVTVEVPGVKVTIETTEDGLLVLDTVLAALPQAALVVLNEIFDEAEKEDDRG